MAKLSHADSRRMYSWWWDSHISPKNSKWLQENLTDMDVKVKTMIKLIEEDADSFARRAEMYYKKRPELMKLVEEFYRAYRALAERYDHATGVIRHAHRTMTEAFPNQLPQMFADDSTASSVRETDPRTPEILTSVCALREENGFDSPDQSNSHAVKQSGEFTVDSVSVTGKKALKQINDMFGPSDPEKFAEVRKGLNFDEADVKEQILLKSENVGESEGILILKEALAKLEAEKEAGLAQYQQSLTKLSNMELDLSHAQEISRALSDRANEAENEAVTLKNALSKLESEKETNLQKYQECLEKLSNLEKHLSSAQVDLEELNGRASRAETEAQSLKDELAKVSAEKDEALDNYVKSLETISDLENKLRITEEDARKLKERAEKAESEIEVLKQTVSKLIEEKEAVALEYQKCLETISSLEKKLARAKEEAQHLSSEIDNGVSKLKGAEEQCLLLERSNQLLHSELESLMLKMGTQTQELTEKDKEVGKLWACIQEERLRFVEAETAFQTLQHLHAQTQDELQSMASELQKRAQLLKTIETRNQSLQDEVLRGNDENKHLNELNESSALSIKDMECEIISLKGTNGKLEEEVELHLDERNALQQEIYCLREKLNDLNKKHVSVSEQVRAVGLNPESVESSVKELQDENSRLKETCSREQNDKVALLAKLEILGQLLEKNSVLENSLSDLNGELGFVRGKIEALERSCQFLSEEKSTLLDEKATLTTQLQVTSENLAKLSEKNSFLENSLSDAHDELQALKVKSKGLEDSYELLEKAKAVLIGEKDGLMSQLGTTHTRLEGMLKIYGDLEERYTALEKAKESTLGKLEGLEMSLDVERRKHASFVQVSEARFMDITSEMHLSQEESQQRKRELDEVLDNAFFHDIETFVLRKTAQELEDNNCSLLIENQKLLEESSLSEKAISQLEQDNIEQKFEIKSLFDQATSVRDGIYRLLKALDIVQDLPCNDQIGQDRIHLGHLLGEVQDMKKSLDKAEVEDQQQKVELSVLFTLLGQLKLEGQTLELEKNTVEQDFKVKTEQLVVLQGEILKLHEINKELLSKLREGDCKQEALMAQIEDLQSTLLELQGACQVLCKENSVIHRENRMLADEFRLLEQKKHILEEENYVLYDEVLSLDTLSLISRNCLDEKIMLLVDLGSDLVNLHDANGALTENLSSTEARLEELQMENFQVKEVLLKAENELTIISVVKENLGDEIETEKNMLLQKERELQEAEQKINLVETKKFELIKIVEDLSLEYNELKMIIDSRENQILKLSTDNDHLSMENNRLYEERQKNLNEIEMWETRALSLFDQWQISLVSQLLYEEKFHELCESFLDSTNEIEGLNIQLAAYGPAVISLKECISSLEAKTGLPVELQDPADVKMEGARPRNHLVGNYWMENEQAVVPGTFSDLQDLLGRVRTIEQTTVKMNQLMVQENVDMHSKLEAATRQLEELKSESIKHRRNSKPASEISEADNTLMPKDIMLDQISESPSYGVSKRGPIETDNQGVESWDSADPDDSTDRTDIKLKKSISPSSDIDTDYYHVKSIKKQKGESLISDEKELSVDKLEISKRFSESLREGNKSKVLERLNSDVQKLANLQITVQDLKKKLEITETSKRGKTITERETVKRQLEEAGVAISKLFDLNGKLIKNVEDSSFSDAKSSFDSEENGSVKRRTSEQARRMSEKIGQLQLEVQKIQFVLLKLDDEKDSRGKSHMSETKRRILLRDYLYGVGRTSSGRKKLQFCACVQPRTTE